MYTSCPECGTVFRITINDLRLAEGYVRCGHCAATFNALAALSDDPPPGVAASRGKPAAPVPEQRVSPEISAPDEGADDTLEFDLPEDSWSNFFGGPGSDTPAPTTTGPATEAKGLDLDDMSDWQALLDEVQDDETGSEPVYVIGKEQEPEADPDSRERHIPDDEDPARAAPDAVPADRAEASAPEPEPQLEPQPEPEPEAEPEPEPGPPPLSRFNAAPRSPPVADRPFVWSPPPTPVVEPRRHRGYATGSAVAALLLVMQVLHLQRDDLATRPALAEPLQRAYAALGLTLLPAWDLGAYEIRASEAVADRSSPGALDILARVAVVGDKRVGLPLVRVTLRDRFGKPLGSRVFKPSDYLGKNPRPREPVSPGTLVPVELSLRDPGRDAQGFDVDVCLQSRRDGIICRNDREPFTR